MSTLRAIVIGAVSFVATGIAIAGEHLPAVGGLIA
jgi:hypothetical protein